MAILSNLVVNGASRFLNTAYFNDVSISGTASLASLSLSGTLAVTGAATLSGALNVSGATSLAGLNVSGTATFSKTTDLSGTANNGPALIVGGAVGSAHIEIDANEIQQKASGTTTGNLYINNDGGTVYLSGQSVYANGSTFVAPTTNVVTLNSTNVNVSNNLHATHFDLQTVAQLGGSFYVSPTLKFPNSGTKLAVSKSSTALTLTIKDSSISTSTMAGIAWTVNSAVKVSGTINGVVTGTMDGTITGITNGSQMVVQVSGGNWNSVAATSTDLTASQFSDLTVMVYQRRVVDGSTNNDYRVGIWMNCYDIANSSATIRVYGGTSSAPNVLLGNLTNAGLGTVNGITPSGWGLYAQNAFLWGSIVSTEGQIGGWTIGDTKLYNNTDSMTSTSAGIYLGTNGIRNYKDANTFVNITGGVITAKAVDLTGKITATSGSIAGWRIEPTYLASGTATAPAANTLLLCPAGTISSYTVAGTASTGWMITAGTTFGVNKNGGIYATSGKIAGWSIDTNSLQTGTYGTENGVILCTGTSSAKSIGGSASISGWTITSGAKFGVTKTGVVYGSDVHLTGEITANTGYIGGSSGFTITAGKMYSSTHSAYNTGVAGVYIGTDYIALGSGGATYFKNDGTGKVGPWTLSSTYLRNGNIASATNATVAGVYLGTDGLNISNGTAATTSYITKSAVNIGNKLTWNGTTLSVTGNINATSGKVGNWTIGEDMLMGMSTIQIPGSTDVIKNRTYLYSGELNYGALTATKNADGGTMYITPTTGNVSVCAKFSTRPVHPDSAGQYSNTYWVAPSVQVTGYTGYISIKYTFDYLGGETEGGTGTIFQRENITSTSQTTVYSLIQMKNANDIIRNIDTLITFETPVANNQITVRCPIYTLSHSTIYFYEQAVEAFYGDNFTAMSIQREDTNGDISETFKIDQSGYVYASDIQLNGDITNGNGVSLNELSVRGTVQSASKSVAITSSNTIGATPAIGAQLTLTPGTYLLWGRFVFSTAGSGTSRNNRIAFYTGASPTDSTMLTESQVCVFTAARNWGALTTTYIVSPTENTTYTVGGTSSLPGPDGGLSVIKAIRLL